MLEEARKKKLIFDHLASLGVKINGFKIHFRPKRTILVLPNNLKIIIVDQTLLCRVKVKAGSQFLMMILKVS